MTIGHTTLTPTDGVAILVTYMACHPDTYWWRRYTGNLSSSHWNSFEDGVLCKCDPHYLLSSGSRMASLNSMPSVMYLIRVSALVESSKRTQWPTWWKSRQMVSWLLYRNYFSYLFFNKTFSIFIFLLRTCMSYDRLTPIMGFPILVRWHLYIDSGPRLQWINLIGLSWGKMTYQLSNPTPLLCSHSLGHGHCRHSARLERKSRQFINTKTLIKIWKFSIKKTLQWQGPEL